MTLMKVDMTALVSVGAVEKNGSQEDVAMTEVVVTGMGAAGGAQTPRMPPSLKVVELQKPLRGRWLHPWIRKRSRACGSSSALILAAGASRQLQGHLLEAYLNLR
jgi:hypothetical protein